MFLLFFFVLVHIIFLCLNLGFMGKAADIEAGRGHRGSAKVRVEAFFTLRMLVAKVISGLFDSAICSI